MIKKLLIAALVALASLQALAQTTITLPIAANAIADIGNGPIKVRMIAGNASIFTSQGSGVGSTSGASTALTLTGTPATSPIVGGLISGAGITSGTTITAYNGTTGITLSAAMTVAGGTAVAWGAACPSTPPSNVIQASPQADYSIMYTQARVCAVSPGGPVNTLLIDPIFYDQTSPIAAAGAAVNPVSFGADPNGILDSAPALNAALAASNYVLFPPGHFIFASKITYTTMAGVAGYRPGVTLAGSGPEVTVLDWNNSTDGIEIDYGTVQSTATVRDLTIETNQNGAGIGLVLKQAIGVGTGAAAHSTILRNLQFRGEVVADKWLSNIIINNISNVIVDSVNILGGAQVGTGLEFGGSIPLGSGAQAVVLYIHDSIMASVNIGVQIDAQSQGIFLSNFNCTAINTCVLVPSGIAVPLAEMTITNSQLAVQPSGKAIDFESGISAVSVSNTLFILQASAVGILSNSAAMGGITLTGNFFAPAGAGTTGVSIVTQASATGTMLSSNSFTGIATGLILGASTDYITASGNTFTGITGTAISNSSTGTHNQIFGNPGYNPVGVTAAANVCASPCTITAGPSLETHYVKQSANFNAAITKSGNALCTTPSAAVPCVIDLGPNEAMVVTWTTTTPTDTKDVH